MVKSGQRFLRRDFLKTAAAAGLGLGMAGLLDFVQQPSASAATAIRPFRFATAPGVDSSPLFAAIDNGNFNKRGIDAKVDLFGTGPELVNAVITGQDGVATIGTVVLFTGVERGVPIRVVALVHGSAAQENYGSSSIVARPGIGIGPGEIGKLRGRKIGIPVGTDGDGALRAFLRTAGMTYDHVQIVNIRPADTISALQQGSIDAFCVFEPWPSVALVQVLGAIRVNTTVPPTFQPGVLISTPDTIRANRDLLVDFLAGFAEAQQWARKNRFALIKIIERYAPAVPADAARQALLRVSFDMRLSKRVLQGFKDKTLPDLVTLGLVKSAYDPATAVDSTLNVEVQKRYPELFSDLPPIPASDRLG